MKVAALALVATGAASASQQSCFVPAVGARSNLAGSAARRTSSTSVQMKLWDFGLNREAITGPSQVDENWKAQQEMLKRRNNKGAMEKYKSKVNDKRAQADAKANKWKWQTEKSNKDPLVAWKKMKAAGKIDEIYDDDEEEGGIPIPMASFGVGGSLGVGGKWDEGGRFDLRLPYADQGYVDPDEAPMKKIGSIFGWNKKKEEPEEAEPKSKSKSARKPAAKKGVAKKGAKAKAGAPAAETKPKKTGWW